MEAPATHIIVGVETALGLIFTVGTAAVTTIVGVIMRRVGDMRTQLIGINSAIRELNGKMVRIEEWRDNHMREMDRRMTMLEHRIDSCQRTACPVCELRQKGD